MQKGMQTKAVTGFTLIEVLVAMLILGGAVLGYAMLALQASQRVQEAAFRVQAQWLAADLIARIASNPVAWPAGFSGSAVAAQGDRCSLTRPCSDPLQMAAQDLAENAALVATQLPDGKLAVHAQCGATALPCVAVAWLGSSTDPAACRLAAGADERDAPHCVVVSFWPGA